MAGQGRISCDPFFARSVPWYNAYAKKGHAVTNVRLRTCFDDGPGCAVDALTYEEGDLTLHECTGVLRYVADKDPIVPSDAKEAARVDEAVAMVLTKAGRLSSEITTPLFFVKDSKTRVATGIATVQPILQYYETLLSTQDYVAGDRLSLADFLFAPEVDQFLIVAPALQTQLLDGRVAIAAYLERMRQVDGYTAGFEAAKAYFEALQVPEKLSGVTLAVLERGHFVDVVDDELMCPICLRVVVAPMQCKEGHIFCKGCIETALRVKNECPMDRSVLQVAALSRARTVENLVNKKKIRCPYAAQHTDEEGGCDWVGLVSERPKHIDTECGYTSVPCPHDGCVVRVQQRAVEEHAASCEHRVEACEHCGERGTASHELVCPLAPVVCPRVGCEAQGVRKDTAAHEAECPMMPVECAFKECGCTVGTLLRKDVAAHEKDAATHAAVALAAQKAAREREAALEATVSQLQKEAAEQTKREAALEATVLQLRQTAPQLKDIAEQTSQAVNTLTTTLKSARKREAALEATVLRLRQTDELRVMTAVTALSTSVQWQMDALKETIQGVPEVHGPLRAAAKTEVMLEWRVCVPRGVSNPSVSSEAVDVQSGSQTICRLTLELTFKNNEVFLYTDIGETDGGCNKVYLDGSTITLLKSQDAKEEKVAGCAKGYANADGGFFEHYIATPAEFRNKHLARNGTGIIRVTLCVTPVYAVCSEDE